MDVDGCEPATLDPREMRVHRRLRRLRLLFARACLTRILVISPAIVAGRASAFPSPSLFRLHVLCIFVRSFHNASSQSSRSSTSRLQSPLSTSAAFTMLRLLIYLSRLLAAHILRIPAEKQRRPRRLRHRLFFVTHKSEAEKGIRVCRRHVCAVAVAQAGEDHFAGSHHRHGLALRVHLQAGPVA